ncbi:serine kinase [Qipengyuania aurantiaca]|uniref:Serine kinase n=1 Tax=Qipengyuania aurantiaca TaxID=2867233 RepID=A0ABX8ZJW7_9SPHN|nr:serine kinase [Qipengyuania aurantiaca]QZD89026.1 serine kinase [Qipengyuania aurantiaca]
MKTRLPNVTAVAIDGRGLLIAGEAGSGKSSLALALIDRGATLIGDDGLIIEDVDGYPLACPPKTTRGLLEVRNVGLVELPTCEAPIALVLQLTTLAPRYPMELATTKLAQTGIPVLLFRPGDATQALRAEFALGKHGLVVPEMGDRGEEAAQ